MRFFITILAVFTIISGCMITLLGFVFLSEGVHSGASLIDPKFLFCLTGFMGGILAIWISLSLVFNWQYTKTIRIISFIGSLIPIALSVILFPFSLRLYQEYKGGGWGGAKSSGVLGLLGIILMAGSVIIIITMVLYIVTSLKKKS